MLVGIVVVYNPDFNNVIDNINTYAKQLDKLLIVDNSDVYNQEIDSFSQKNKNVKYLFLGENKGIAYALNRGLDFAKKEKANWLLTMDQDSRFVGDNFSNLLNFIKREAVNYSDGVIFSPLHKVPYLSEESKVVKVDSVMTSGNFINMGLIEKIGHFEEDLFIDSVDHEFCYRINTKGYSVYRLNNIELEHNLGEIAVENFLGKKFYVTHHNHIRRYYITRNLLYVRKKYSKNNLSHLKFVTENIFWTVVTIMLFEKNKLLKLRSIYKGFLDYKQGNLGKKSL